MQQVSARVDAVVHDAIIVGAGPAGASCAVWLARLGLQPLLIESRFGPGGQTGDNPFRDGWIAALPDATGEQVARNIGLSLTQAGVTCLYGEPVTRAVSQAGDFLVERGHGVPLRARTVVLATGVRARMLEGQTHPQAWPGVLIGPGRLVHEYDFKGLRVAILGGGDNAFENYSFVRERGAANVRIYARHVRAQRQFVNQVPAHDIALGPYVVDPRRLTVHGATYDLILVFYGWEPYAPLADQLGLTRDSSGFVVTDAKTTAASREGVYAIGELAHRMHPCVVTAMADGVVAAKAIEKRLAGRARQG